jgi:hypothetical protein
MRRLPLALSRLAAALVLAASGRAVAQTPSPPATCERAEQELQTARADLDRALNEIVELRKHATDAAELRAALERAEAAVAARSADVNECRAERQSLCVEAGAFVAGLSQGQVSRALPECVSSEARHELVERFSGWSTTTSLLAQLGAYSAGESDTMPRLMGSSGTKVEKLAARLLATRNGSPLLYRRLLVEALRLVAPQAWTNIKASQGVERWFSSSEPLEPELVAEASAGTTGKTPGSVDVAAKLSTALELVNAYRVLATCDGPLPPRECRRADELKRVLERNGPLMAQRRIQDIWATECSSLTPAAVDAWLVDLPLSHEAELHTGAIAQAASSKLVSCFLRDSTAGDTFVDWKKRLLSKSRPSRVLDAVERIERRFVPGAVGDRCARAVRAMQTLPSTSECSAPSSLTEAMTAWLDEPLPPGPSEFGEQLCDRFARALWAGQPVSIPNTFASPPTLEDAVLGSPEKLEQPMGRLRANCRARAGSGERFEEAVRSLASIARRLGENPAGLPWFADAETLRPVERGRLSKAEPTVTWLGSLTDPRRAACSLLELDPARCDECRTLPEGSHYDCSLVDRVYAGWQGRTLAWLERAGLLAAAWLALFWSLRLRRARREYGEPLGRARGRLAELGLEPRFDPLRFLLPSRHSYLSVQLPKHPAWERWGSSAVLVSASGALLKDRDVNRAALVARSLGAELALVIHEDSTSPALGAVRAMLEWSARGAGRAVQVVPVSWNRLKWARDASDLLELAEETSLRSNPFEVRGRLTSSSQFFNRERLVSGLLANAQAGHPTIVTGLRRFGKSSLALEVARRLPGPAAYVDLAGFHHEIRFSNDPAEAADAILRFLCLKLVESARSRYAGRFGLEVPEGELNAAKLTSWFGDFMDRAARAEGGKAPPVLLILDEIEQAIGAARELSHALDVFAIVVGRLRNSLPGSSQGHAPPVGLLFASALHPLLWSPLGTLAHQSLIGSFEWVSVPCLPEDAAASMMRGLGARQGIRFTDAALELLLKEGQGVPLLVRRLGSAVLELYDPERARQGALGAVEVGIEGVRAAVEREAQEGSPSRVWIESEIADPVSPGGALLRHLAQAEWVTAGKLRRLAATHFLREFERTGVALALNADEALRRAEEAAGVLVRLLGECGLLEAKGDPSEPDAYLLPRAMIRRVLQSDRSEDAAVSVAAELSAP